DLSWVPIPFGKSFRMAYSRTHYGTGYYIYHQYVGGAPLSCDIRPWDSRTVPDRDVLELIGRAGTDLSPTNGLRELSGIVSSLGAVDTRLLCMVTNAPSTIRKLSFSVPLSQAVGFGKARLRLTWDERSAPSVDAPVALFFGAGTLYNRE